MNILMNKPMNKSIKSLTVIGSCIMILLSSNAYANDVNKSTSLVETKEIKMKHHHKKKRGHMKAIAKALDLSEEQRAQMKQIKENARNENEALFTQMKTFKENAKTLLQSDVFDEGAYIALLDEYQSVRSQLALNMARSKHASRQVLTEEQKVKFDNLKRKKLAF